MTDSVPDPRRLDAILKSMGASWEQLRAAEDSLTHAPVAKPDDDAADLQGDDRGDHHGVAAKERQAPRLRQVPAHVYHAARNAGPTNKQRMDEAVRWARETGLISRPISCTLSTLVGFLPWKQAAAGQFLVFPSNATLSDVLGISPRSVQRHLDALEAAGLIIREYREGRNGLVRKGISLAPFAAQIETLFNGTVEKARDRRRRAAAEDMPADRMPIEQTEKMSPTHDKIFAQNTSPNQNLSHCTGNQGDVARTSSDDASPQKSEKIKTREYRLKQQSKRISRIRILAPDWPSQAEDLVATAQADFSDVTVGLGLPKRVWREAVDRHGDLAVAAMVAMAMVKRDIRTTRIAWLRGCLQKGRESLDAWGGLEAEIKRQRPNAWPPAQ